jgi:hypothetical protein
MQASGAAMIFLIFMIDWVLEDKYTRFYSAAEQIVYNRELLRYRIRIA